MAQSAEAANKLLELKAAYIYRFTSFIDWPETAPRKHFTICVIGDPAMQTALGALERTGRRADGRPVAVRGFRDGDDPAACQILFVGATATKELASIARRSAGEPVLLVGDRSGLAGRGLAIELFSQSDILRKSERLRFRIDPRALEGRGLTVSAQLYEVAEVIR